MQVDRLDQYVQRTPQTDCRGALEGFNEPLYQENYHPEYYRAFFENWGFQPYEQILTFRGKVKEVPIQRLQKTWLYQKLHRG